VARSPGLSRPYIVSTQLLFLMERYCFRKLLIDHMTFHGDNAFAKASHRLGVITGPELSETVSADNYPK